MEKSWFLQSENLNINIKQLEHNKRWVCGFCHIILQYEEGF